MAFAMTIIMLVFFNLLTSGVSSASGLPWRKAGRSPCGDNEVPFPTAHGSSWTCEALESAQREATGWLKQRLPPWDQFNEATLFGEPDGPDGLDTGVASVGVNTSLHAKIAFPWAWDVPKDIFNNYILPYASVNENRNNWRPFLSAVIKPLLDTLPRDATVTDVFNVINGGTDAPSLWSLLGNSANGGSIVFKSSQTPLIFDPMSTIAYGFASCTGISILVVDALRAAGVAARLAGTPAWQGKDSNGNHNWLEVYLPGGTAGEGEGEGEGEGSWHFVEGLPAGGGETLANPCDKWFCNPGAFASPNGTTQVFAAQFDSLAAGADAGVHYPMAWDRQNLHIPGVNRTKYYAQTCSKC